MKQFFWLFLLRGVVLGAFYAVWQTYLLSQGLSSTDVIAINTGVLAFGLLIDIPTGLLADRFGVRKITLLGFSFLAIGYAVLGLSTSISGFIVGVFVISGAASFLNGAIQAWAAQIQQCSHGELRLGLFAKRDQARTVGMILGSLCFYLCWLLASLIHPRWFGWSPLPFQLRA